MVTIQPIEHEGRVVALVVGGLAIIDDELAGAAVAVVRAKCLYALQVASGERDEEYSDALAARYAERATAGARLGRSSFRRRR
jgi:hypothetical protein